MELRPYQIQAEAAIMEEWRKGNRKTLLVLPTGCGKTVVFTDIAWKKKAEGENVLILAHRKELISQAEKTLQRLSRSGGPDISVMSVQTMQRHMDEFRPDEFQVIIVDEAHHALSDSYQMVLNYFPEAKVLGVTATPDRGDKKKLGNWFDSLAFEYPLRDAIQDGYLCPVRAQMIPLTIDLSQVSVREGDYAPEEIGLTLDPLLDRIAEEMKTLCAGRRTVVFLPLIRTSRRFCRILNEKGLRAREVNGESGNRTETLDAFARGEFDILCNSMLLTEGWDCPAVDCLIILRPTRIRSLYQQMVGRGLRPFPGKEYLLLPDFLWLSGKHSLCRPSGLLGDSEEIIQGIDASMEASPGISLDLMETERKIQRDIIAEREATVIRALRNNQKKTGKLVDPIEYSLSLEACDLIDYEPIFKWEKEPITARQLSTLAARGIDADRSMTKGMASKLIDRVFLRQRLGLATPRQMKILRRYGFEHPGTWRFEEAKQIIDRIAANGWRWEHGEYQGMPAVYPGSGTVL